ncbi:MAG: DUF4262 domain-containing protein [Mycobacterium sp.]
MCWQCDNPHRTTEDYLDVLRAIIRTHRWAVQYVEGEDQPFGYTVGLHRLGLPELMIMGLPPEESACVLRSIAHDMVDDGRDLRPPLHINFQGELFLEVVKVEHPDVHLGAAVALFGPDIRALQLVWTDDHSSWPWDRGWIHGRRRQPVLGQRTRLAG